MTFPAQIALDFCRECLGWSEIPAYDITDGVAFSFNDLKAVMDAVRTWCDRTGCRIELHYSPEQNGFGVLCEGVDKWSENPCEALMTACVEAARKLRAA